MRTYSTEKKISVFCFILPMLLLAVPAHASCTPPTQARRLEIQDYVMKLNHVGSRADIILVSDSQANDGCFWKFTYNVGPSNRELTMYLSPDGHYLTPTLYDTSVDPLVAEQTKLRAAIKELSEGQHPSRGPAR